MTRPRTLCLSRRRPAPPRLALAAGALAGASLLVLAAEARGDQLLDRLDANRDGVVTYAEAEAYEAQAFAALDANGDGLISFVEWDRIGEGRFAYLDRNADGLLQPAELAALSGVAYDPLPATTYGSDTGPMPDYIPPQQAMLPRAPMPAPAYQPYPAVSPAPGNQAYGVAPSPYPTYPGYGPPNAPEAEAFYNAALGSGDPLALDADKDGRLSLLEVQHYNVGNFQRHDVDRNGVLTAEEWDLKAQEHFGYRVNPAPLQTLTEDTFAEHDLDGDGMVTRYEWDARVQTEFAILDRDRNGFVAPYEITASN